MKQTLEIGVQQQLTMTPQLQQAIRLLQLSTLELQAEIQEALETNTLLELEDGADGEADAEPATDTRNEQGADGVEGLDAPAGSGDSDIDMNGNEQLPDELSVDVSWEDTYPDLPSTRSGGDSDLPDPGVNSARAEELIDHLRWQLDLTPFTDTDRAVASLLIDAVDHDGYLRTSVEDVVQVFDDAEVDEDTVLAVLHRVQRFDPPGIAARDLAECLALQLDELQPVPQGMECARRLLPHLDLLGEYDLRSVVRRSRLSEDQVHAGLAVLRSLNPRPGTQFDGSDPDYIVPDVLVTRRNGHWHVELNPAIAPRLRIHSGYQAMIRRRDRSADNTYLRDRLNEARWFLNSLRSRNDTLLRVATCIVERQIGFFEQGDEAMKPMVLQDVATELEMHQSTISRVTNSKYMHTPRGVYELKYFFSSSLATADGDATSGTAIRAEIRKLIEHEDKPLSDARLAEILNERGIDVARRTVAKYREAMNIPPSSQRRKQQQLNGHARPR